jgi:hypothetical protein
VEGPHPDQLLLEGPKEPLSDAFAFGLPDERRRCLHAEEGDPALKVFGHVVRPVVVPQLQAGGDIRAGRPEMPPNTLPYRLQRLPAVGTERGMHADALGVAVVDGGKDVHPCAAGQHGLGHVGAPGGVVSTRSVVIRPSWSFAGRCGGRLEPERSCSRISRRTRRSAVRTPRSRRRAQAVDASFCVAALKRALEAGCRPEIFNTDQGAQFTSEAFTGLLSDHDIRISMDGRGRCQDNIFVERLWRSLKYEEVYLSAYDTVGDTETGIGAWMGFYNYDRPYQALGNCTPAAVYAGGFDVRACGRPATPAGWAAPGVLDGPGPAHPATTSPHAHQPVVQAAPGLDNLPPTSATLAPGEMPAHPEGPNV